MFPSDVFELTNMIRKGVSVGTLVAKATIGTNKTMHAMKNVGFIFDSVLFGLS